MCAKLIAMRKYSVFGIRSSVFALMITGYWILNTLALPTPSLAQLCDPPGGTLGTGVESAIGCLAAGDPKLFISQLLGWGVGIGGGIAFLMIIFAGFQMATASGDPKRVKAAQELLTSALAGLILIVLSLVLLNFIGVKILGLNILGFSLSL